MGHVHSFWTEKEISILQEMAGKSQAAEIGKIIGRSIEGVRKMTKKLGLESWKQTSSPPLRPSRLEPPKKVTKIKIKGTLEWCPTCGSPVSDWAGHTSRIGCKRTIA